MGIIEDESVSNPSANETFENIIAERVSRRSLLRGGAAAAGAAVAFTGADALVRAVPAHADGVFRHHGYGKGYGRPAGTPLLGFEGIETSVEDTVVVPPGYHAEVLIAWGDPVSDGPAFKQDGTNTAEEQAQQWGMHNDGIVYFPIFGSKHGLIVQNHEYSDDGLLFADNVQNWDAAKTAKSQNAHGVGIIEVKRRRSKWEVVRPSKYARRITGQTPITFAGPAAGHDLLKTKAEPTGTTVLGTINNCAMGYTPWGTYLACEENFNGYFRKTALPNDLEARYGINANGAGYLWHTTDTRFQVDTEPNEPNRFGWVCEIDPFKRESTPVKRTALGRIKHEGAWVQEARDGRVVVYMGDDERFEYIYRYVSRLPWRKSIRQGVHPLDDGTLFVARFDANGTGEWLPLTPDNPVLAGWTLGDILVKTRQAADLAGATKMDRPEWIDTYPDELMAIASLTNNSNRTAANVDAANPRPSNVYGHILRWGYDIDFTGPTFWWDIFALAGDRDVPAHGATVNGDKYGSPDGLYVAPSGRLWIQTDVSTSTIDLGAYAGFGNNQMLCADPTTRRTRRFLVGPKQCEITGCFATPDETTLFVGIQHPGEIPAGTANTGDPKQYSTWPDGAAAGRPRSALLVITKDDGGEIGS
jgi:uncharacterized protein